MAGLSVHRAGLMTTIQDEGRWGYQAAGVPVAGPMDGWSHRLANLLVGNPRDAATLEITGTGPDLRFDRPARLAIAGAAFSGHLDGRPWTSPVVLEASAGSRLTFGDRLRGFRAYLAAAGGFDAPLVLGSRATDMRSGLGGLNGRALRDGDRVLLAPGRQDPTVRAVPPDAGWMLPEAPARLRIVLGPDSDDDDAGRAFEQLVGGSFTVSPQSDRMGYRLTGGPVRIGAAPRISAPVTTGLVQVPPSGDPVLLMADRQTTGGYAAAAVVIAADLPRAAQLGPGDRLRFERCDHEAALHALLHIERTLLAIDERAGRRRHARRDRVARRVRILEDAARARRRQRLRALAIRERLARHHPQRGGLSL